MAVDEDTSLCDETKLQNCEVPDFFLRSVVEDHAHRPTDVRCTADGYEAMFHLGDGRGGRRIVYPLSMEPGKFNSYWAPIVPNDTRVACSRDYRTECQEARRMWPRELPNDWVEYFRRVNRRTQTWNTISAGVASACLTVALPRHPHDRAPYQQVAGSFACMVKSLAQAMVYRGGAMIGLASEIHQLGIRIKPNSEMCKNVTNMINKVLNPHGLSFARCGKEHFFQPGAQYQMPMLVKLKHVPHCFAVCGGVIFEPSLPAPLPSSTESLDYICGGEGLYRGIQWTNRIVLTAETSKESKRRRKRGRTGCLPPALETNLAAQPDAKEAAGRSGSAPVFSVGIFMSLPK